MWLAALLVLSACGAHTPLSGPAAAEAERARHVETLREGLLKLASAEARKLERPRARAAAYDGIARAWLSAGKNAQAREASRSALSAVADRIEERRERVVRDVIETLAQLDCRAARDTVAGRGGGPGMDRLLTSIAKGCARAGNLDDALEAVGAIERRGWVGRALTALLELAPAERALDELAAPSRALVGARGLKMRDRVDVLSGIALVEGRLQRWVEAAASLGDALREAHELDNDALSAYAVTRVTTVVRELSGAEPIAPEAGRRFTDAALSLARGISSPGHRGRALKAVAEALVETGAPEAARELVDETAVELRKLKQPTQARELAHLAHLAARAGARDAAFALIDEAWQGVSGDRRDDRALNQISRVYSLLHRFAAAERSAELVMEPLLRGDAWSIAARELARAGNAERALELAERIPQEETKVRTIALVGSLVPKVLREGAVDARIAKVDSRVARALGLCHTADAWNRLREPERALSLVSDALALIRGADLGAEPRARALRCATDAAIHSARFTAVLEVIAEAREPALRVALLTRAGAESRWARDPGDPRVEALLKDLSASATASDDGPAGAERPAPSAPLP